MKQSTEKRLEQLEMEVPAQSRRMLVREIGEVAVVITREDGMYEVNHQVLGQADYDALIKKCTEVGIFIVYLGNSKWTPN